MKLIECNLPCKFGRKALPKIPKEKLQNEITNDAPDDVAQESQGIGKVATQQVTKLQNHKAMERKMIERRMSDFENEK